MTPQQEQPPQTCSGCGGRRWAEDENWSPADPATWKGERSHGNGLIPCGFCNEGGWNTPDYEPEPATPSPDALRAALERIAPMRNEAVGYLRKYGFVMDVVGPLREDSTELDRWKVLAFSLYSDLAQASILSEEALAATPSPSSGLDVERLAEYLTVALHETPHWRYPRSDERGAANVLAGILARKVARLQEQER